MNMSEFVSMGGYSSFIWSAFGLTLTFIVAEVINVRRQHKNIMRRIQRFQQLQKPTPSGEQQ